MSVGVDRTEHRDGCEADLEVDEPLRFVILSSDLLYTISV